MKPFHIFFIGMSLVVSLWFLGYAEELDLTKASTPKTFKQYDAYIKGNAPEEDAFVAVQRVAEPYIQDGQWEKAANVFKTYRPLFETMDTRFEKVISLLEAAEESLVVANLGSGINTDADEYAPVPSADGLRLYFLGRLRSDCYGGEDVFVSELQDSIWQKAVNLGKSINTNLNEAVQSITADGNRIILFGNYEETFGGGDIFYADKTADGWGEIQHFPEPTNSQYFDADASMTSDGKAILFTSDRPGGIGSFHEKSVLFHGHHGGNTDIYVCLLTEEGWSEPINLGATINTPYTERTPFLHPDGKTLYFSSDGHYGLGRLDVFIAVRLKEDSWTEWSELVNLGKEINTADDDWGYKVATAGDVAYFSARGKSGGYGGSDIYSRPLPDTARPEPVATISGKVTDDSGNPLEAAIKWEDLSTGKNMGQLKSDPQDGSYFIVLPLGKNYGYHAEKEGYLRTSNNIDLRNETESLNITEDIVLRLIEEIIEEEIPVRINNIFFDFDKSELKLESFPELDYLAKILQEHPDKKVEISGHTCNIGTEAYNLDLSNRRAQSVVEYLISVGCDDVSLISTGYGESKPIASNETEEERAQNRRVEFRFLKQ